MRVLILILILVVPFFSFAAEQMQSITLLEALKFSDVNNVEIKIKEAEVKEFLAKDLEISSKFNPTIKMRLGVGPITEERGNALSSVENKDAISAAYLGQIEMTWPIFTWNRKSDFMRASKHGEMTKRFDVIGEKNRVHFKVKEAYFGTLLAYSLKDFVVDQKKKVEEILDKHKKKLKKTERYQVELFLNQIEQKEQEIAGLLKKALLGLRFSTGVDRPIRPKEEWIEARDEELKELAVYQEILRKEHFQFKKIKSGLEAKQALIRGEEKGAYPALAIFMKYDWSQASGRDIQQSSFAYDPYNNSQLLGGIGFEWNYQWGATNAKVEKLNMERNKILAQKKMAESGLSALLEKSWLEVKMAQQNLRLVRKSYKTSKKWLNRVFLSASLGKFKIGEMAQVFKTRASIAKDYFEAIYSHEMAWAAFYEALGQDLK